MTTAAKPGGPLEPLRYEHQLAWIQIQVEAHRKMMTPERAKMIMDFHAGEIRMLLSLAESVKAAQAHQKCTDKPIERKPSGKSKN